MNEFMISLGAPIISLEHFALMRPNIEGTLVATSVFADPIHPGHISCIQESVKFGDKVVVIVNGDPALHMKKGKHFQDHKTRSMIVSAIKGVDFVVPFHIENDGSVNVALDAIKPDIFTKGGDRNIENIPEVETLKKHNIKFVSNVGVEKLWSSSDFLQDWMEFVSRNEDKT